MTQSPFAFLKSLGNSTPNAVLAAAFVSGATRVFPVIERLGKDSTKRTCRGILDDLWSFLNDQTIGDGFQKHLQTLKALPESSEWDSHKPAYYVQRAIGVMWDTVRGLAEKSKQGVLQDWLGGVIEMSSALDGLISINIGHDSHLEDREIQYQQDVFQFLRDRPKLDVPMVAELKERSLQMSESYRIAIEEIARNEAWL